MLKYVFNKYDSVLETIRFNVSSMLNIHGGNKRNSIQLQPNELLDLEISKQELNLKEKKDISIKHEIQENIIYLKLKKLALQSTNLYIKRAEDILRDRVEESAYEALFYLKRVPSNLSKEKLIDVSIFKAMVHELIGDFDEATIEYKKALKFNNRSDILVKYKEFVERSREVLSWHKAKKEQLRYSSLNIHNIAKKDDMPNIAKKLDSISKYYARSPKSRDLGKRYFKEVIKIYKILAYEEPKKYTCDYINTLIDAVEYFMFSTTLLKEASDILYNSDDCIDMRVYLAEKIKELKEKRFIKSSIS